MINTPQHLFLDNSLAPPMFITLILMTSITNRRTPIIDNPKPPSAPSEPVFRHERWMITSCSSYANRKKEPTSRRPHCSDTVEEDPLSPSRIAYCNS
ncbi:hypothetical protein FRC03_006863 [Tulasnella sp. 419]|nr:hypothetical protein FRC03_006863 [Tulasnella sp. 419]